MNQYHIRIDGVRSPDPYTYQELVNMGLFELDNDSMNGIEVKTTSNPNFSPLKSYCFPESQSNDSSYYIDELCVNPRQTNTYINTTTNEILECENAEKVYNGIVNSFSKNHQNPKKYLDKFRIMSTIYQELHISLIKSGGGNGPMKPGNLFIQGAKSGGNER